MKEVSCLSRRVGYKGSVERHYFLHSIMLSGAFQGYKQARNYRRKVS